MKTKTELLCERVAAYYDRDEEENRFLPLFKQIEMINTRRLLSLFIPEGARVLDCAAGTGIYVDCLLQKKAVLSLSDLSHKHAELLERKYGSVANVFHDNALDLSRYKDGSFDAVLCFGPAYHLDREDCEACLRECLRVLNSDGILMVAYINRHFIGLDLMFSEAYPTGFDEALSVMKNGYAAEKSGFFGCAFFYSPEEIETIAANAGAAVVDHRTTDADIPFFFSKMREFSEEKIFQLADYVEREGSRRTMLGCSKHNMVILKKAGR